MRRNHKGNGLDLQRPRATSCVRISLPDAMPYGFYIVRRVSSIVPESTHLCWLQEVSYSLILEHRNDYT